MRLAQLLASMKDDDGRVLVDGFYDGRAAADGGGAGDARRRAGRSAALKALFGIAAPEQAGLKLQEALQFPSLNIRGLSSAFVGGKARTIIPDRAMAEIDMRLVKETPAERMRELVLAHIRAQGYHVVTTEPDDETRARYPQIVQLTLGASGTNAYRTVDAPADLEEVARRRMHERASASRRSQFARSAARCRSRLHRGARLAGDQRADRQLRQQPARREREPPPRALFRAIVTIAALLTM